MAPGRNGGRLEATIGRFVRAAAARRWRREAAVEGDQLHDTILQRLRARVRVAMRLVRFIEPVQSWAARLGTAVSQALARARRGRTINSQGGWPDWEERLEEDYILGWCWRKEPLASIAAEQPLTPAAYPRARRPLQKLQPRASRAGPARGSSWARKNMRHLTCVFRVWLPSDPQLCSSLLRSTLASARRAEASKGFHNSQGRDYWPKRKTGYSFFQ